jgi:hypothetical protein
MTCPHTDTTAVLAAFGEAPPEFSAHLDQCPSCRDTIRTHTETLATLGAIEEVAPPAPRHKTRWTSWSAGMLLAAAALLAVSVQQLGDDPQRYAQDSPVPLARLSSSPLPFQSDLDSDIADLELELALLNLE